MNHGSIRIETRRIRTVGILTAMAAIGVLVAGYFDIELFPSFQITGRIVAVSLAALVGVLILAELLLQARTLEQRKELWVRQVIPQENAAKVLWVVAVTIAGLTEEIIFRGVLFGLIVALTKSTLAGALISAVVFAAAHIRQGWKSMIFIGAIALLFQWLVIYTGSLIPAMVIHAVYNIVRGLRATKAMRDVESVTPRPAA